MKPENVATVKSNELLAGLETDDLDVILREKRLCWLMDTLNDPVEQLKGLQHADRRKAWTRPS